MNHQHLSGLTKRQAQIANKLWTCNTNEEVMEYIGTLSKKDHYDARSLIICLLQNMAEANHDGSFKDAIAVIDQIMKK